MNLAKEISKTDALFLTCGTALNSEIMTKKVMKVMEVLQNEGKIPQSNPEDSEADTYFTAFRVAHPK